MKRCGVNILYRDAFFLRGGEGNTPLQGTGETMGVITEKAVCY